MGTKFRLLAFGLVGLMFFACSEKPKTKTNSGEFDAEAVALNKRAVVLMSANKLDSALILLDKAIKTDKTYFVAHTNKATLYINRADYNNARKELELALEINPDMPESWLMAGMLSERIGDTIKANKYYQKSVEAFDKTLSNSQENNKIVPTRMSRAMALILMGKEQEGREEMAKLKQENPQNMAIDELSKIDKKDFVKNFFY